MVLLFVRGEHPYFANLLRGVDRLDYAKHKLFKTNKGLNEKDFIFINNM